MPVSMLLVEAKAHSIYEDLSEGDDNVKPFSRFMKRYNFYNIKLLGKLLLLTLWLPYTI